jgi:general stress protein 26
LPPRAGLTSASKKWECKVANKTLTELAEKLRGIDIVMLSTSSDATSIRSRPMSNNGDVDYDGDSYYFTFDKSNTVQDIQRNPLVAVAFIGKAGLLSGPSFYASVAGRAEIFRDKAAFKAHWVPSLNMWFKQGIDTPGVALIKVHAERIRYWEGEDHGELVLAD